MSMQLQQGEIRLWKKKTGLLISEDEPYRVLQSTHSIISRGVWSQRFRALFYIHYRTSQTYQIFVVSYRSVSTYFFCLLFCFVCKQQIQAHICARLTLFIKLSKADVTHCLLNLKRVHRALHMVSVPFQAVAFAVLSSADDWFFFIFFFSLSFDWHTQSFVVLLYLQSSSYASFFHVGPFHE